MPGEFLAPLSQRRLSDVQPFALLAHGFNDDVNVGVALIDVKGHGVPVREGKLLLRKPSDSLEKLVWRGTCRHGQHDVMDQLGRLATGSPRIQGSRLLGVKIEAPVLEQCFFKAVAQDPFSIVGLDSQFPLTPYVVDVLADSPHGSRTTRYFHHDLRRAPHRPGNVIALRCR
jgi:hypothetical protein